jgi:preprotein translocase subunit YajC
MRLIIGTLTAVGIGLASPALAQGMHVTTITPGIHIVDAAGAPVGTVIAVKGDNVEVKTDKHEALLPKTSFTIGNGKLLFGMTQAQLDAQIEQSAAAANSAIVAGATVKSVDGVSIGKIDTVADGKVTIALTAGTKIQVDQSGVAGNPDGTVTVGLTSAQLQAQVQPAAAAAPAPSGE